MTIKLLDKFKALGATAVGVAILAVPFLVPEALPAIPLAFGGFVAAACYANKKISGNIPEDLNPAEDHAYNNHGMTKEDAIESIMSWRRKEIEGIRKFNPKLGMK